uniref:RAWUL domain-containing protein n=1 Tax=Elaeophora elaphi TaxID=1147741 RepID=A0A0R3S2C6_9BILA
MLDGNDLQMAIDVVNDQQLVPTLSNYHFTQHHTSTLTYTAGNTNLNSDNIDNDNNDDSDAMRRHHRRITPFVRRRKRFATAQTSRWNKMTSDNILKLKWFISRYTRDMPRSEIRYFFYQNKSCDVLFKNKLLIFYSNFEWCR